ncbi:energy-coupling factor transporter transmembrane component T [Companilactobacillus sp. HBUAS56257]|uniref:energy-coupling factor transporter transmembrane component T n=1 Tax=Companilactobacillus sp. HBUAS56257 TaxID=3109360 RepID=UPI002FF181A0
MNSLVLNFLKRTNSVTVFIYLIAVILIALLFKQILLSVATLISLLLMSILVRREKFFTYLKFSCVIFIVTVIFNLILNQRGTNVLWTTTFLKITTESISNGITFGLSFVNLLWTFYLYDALIRVKTVFELLASVFKSIAIIFILTIQFIPKIVDIFSETKAIQKFRTQKKATGIKSTMDLTENILNKSIASFMNVSDTLILRGFHNRQKRMGQVEFKQIDWWILTIIGLILIADGIFSQTKNIEFIALTNIILVLLPILTGGTNLLWWKFYGSKTTVSDTTTAKNYR